MQFFTPQEIWHSITPHGRWWIKSINQLPTLYTTNLGSVLRLSINNSSNITVHVLDHHSQYGPSPIFAWRLDHGDWHRVSAAQLKWSIDCQPNCHLLEIITAGNSDLDQVWTGEQGFGITGIELTDAGQIATAPHQPVIDFIGDSITAGCWVNGRHAALDYRPESNYVGIACDELHTTGVRIAYSAGGVLRPATGGVPNARQYLKSLDGTTPWQPNRPNLVVINLGVNDRRYPVEDFVPAYQDFLASVQKELPSCPIVVMIPFSQTWAAEIRQLATQARLSVIETLHWCQSTTDGLHLDQPASIRCGHLLAKSLRPLLK